MLASFARPLGIYSSPLRLFDAYKNKNMPKFANAYHFLRPDLFENFKLNLKICAGNTGHPRDLETVIRNIFLQESTIQSKNEETWMIKEYRYALFSLLRLNETVI